MVLGMDRRASVIVVIVLVPVACLSVPTVEGLPEPICVFHVGSWFNSLAFSPNAKAIACDLVLRNVAYGKVLGTGDPGEEMPSCSCVAFSPDGQRLASIHFDHGLHRAEHALCLWDVNAENWISRAATLLHAQDQSDRYRESLDYLVFSRDGKLLATRLPGDRTVVWDTASGKERLRLETHGLAVAFTHDGSVLTSVSRTGLVQHWDLATRECTDAPECAQELGFLFTCIAVASVDGKTLALSDHRSVILKDAESGKLLRRFDDLAAKHLALSADGKLLAAGNDGIVLLDTATGKEKGRLGPLEYSLRALALSPNGKLLAAGLACSVVVWDVARLARAETPKSVRDAMPLEATVVSRNETYTLALGGKTAHDFARQIEVGQPLPASPKVDLVISLRNVSDRKLELDPKGLITCYLVGEGALNHPELAYSVGVQLEELKKIALAPGESYSIPIRSLDQGHSQQSYWLLPGEYTLHLNYFTSVTPVLEGRNKGKDESECRTIRAAPLRLKVVAEKK